MRSAYVQWIRAIRALAQRIGLIDGLRRSSHPISAHLLSLFAIYDLDQMITLDRPWWTYRAADHVEAFLLGRRSARVFEYGAGASTIWLAKRSAEVHTVEHDAAFAESLVAHLHACPTATLHAVAPSSRTSTSGATSQRRGYDHASFDDYVDTIDRVGGTFDLIVIDGRSRQACLARAVDRLAPDGLIVFDNSNRDRYRSTIDSSGLHERSLRGWCPALPVRSVTSLLTLQIPQDAPHHDS